MTHDFLDNLGAQQYEKIMKKLSKKQEEDYYNSESEGKEFEENDR